MKAQPIPLEFDILCQGEETKRVLKIEKYDDRTNVASGSAGNESSIKKDVSYSSFPSATAESSTIKEDLENGIDCLRPPSKG
jgi:hypothetical protein